MTSGKAGTELAVRNGLPRVELPIGKVLASLFAVGFLGLSLAACGSNEAAMGKSALDTGFVPDAPRWQSELQVEHPLVGRIWSVREEKFVSSDAFAEDFAESSFVLLGEKHDNPDHHRIQAWVIETLVSLGKRPALAFEMIDRDSQEILERETAEDPIDLDALGDALSWEESGWPDWAYYSILIEAALPADAPLYAAGWPRGELRQIAKEGFGGLDPALQKRLGLERDYDEATRDALHAEIMASHCDQLPESMTGPMVNITRLKDAFMAERLTHALDQPGSDVAVLIAGAGHVRNDLGVPWHLAAQAETGEIMALAILEVNAEARTPEDYTWLFQERGLPFDYLWFTPRVDELDPCEAYAEQLRKARESHEKTQGDGAIGGHENSDSKSQEHSQNEEKPIQ